MSEEAGSQPMGRLMTAVSNALVALHKEQFVSALDPDKAMAYEIFVFEAEA